MKKFDQKRILVVDDDVASINALTDILEKDYLVYGAKSGTAAVEFAKKHLPDIILLDIVMPEMDGFEVIAELKKTEETSDIPVVFVTALDDDESIEKGLEYGAADYITKPFHSARIEFRVKNQVKLQEQLRKQTIMAKISKKALSGSYAGSSIVNLIEMPSEFIDIAQVLLYKTIGDSDDLLCRNEWVCEEISLAKKPQSRIGEKFALNNLAASAIKSLLTGDGLELCINSNNLSFKESMKPTRGEFEEFIMIPFMDKGKLCGVLDFSRENDGREWSGSEIDFAVMFSSMFSDAFMRGE